MCASWRSPGAPLGGGGGRVHRTVALVAMIYHREREQNEQREKVRAAKSVGNQVQASKGPPALELHGWGSIPPATSRAKVWEVLSPGEAHQCPGYYWGASGHIGSICWARTRSPDPQGLHINHTVCTVREKEPFLSGKGANPFKHKVPKGQRRTTLQAELFHIGQHLTRSLEIRLSPAISTSFC